MRKLLPVALVAILSFFFTNAHAQLFGGDDQARRQIAELREQMNARIEASSRGQLELANQNEMLRTEVARLRGDIEVLMHEMESLKQRQRDFYVDLDSRLQRVEQTGGPLAAESDPAVEAADYEAALTLLKEGKHEAALAAFESFVAQHPRSQSLANAHFWAGNAALQARNVAAAQTHFTTVLTNWPTDRVAPDAMIGLANSQQALGDTRRSQETLRKVIESYPQSSAAQVARQRLGQ